MTKLVKDMTSDEYAKYASEALARRTKANAPWPLDPNNAPNVKPCATTY